MSKLVIAGSRTVSPTPEEIDQAFKRIDPSGLLFTRMVARDKPVMVIPTARSPRAPRSR